MLVLSRKQEESLVIGTDIRITVLKIERHGVRIGIEAPSGVTILREELLLDTEERAGRRAWNRAEEAHRSSRPAPCSDQND